MLVYKKSVQHFGVKCICLVKIGLLKYKQKIKTSPKMDENIQKTIFFHWNLQKLTLAQHFKFEKKIKECSKTFQILFKIAYFQPRMQKAAREVANYVQINYFPWRHKHYHAKFLRSRIIEQGLRRSNRTIRGFF